MSFTITIRGHADSPDKESAVIEDLRKVIGELERHSYIESAVASTQWHKKADLKALPDEQQEELELAEEVLSDE